MPPKSSSKKGKKNTATKSKSASKSTAAKRAVSKKLPSEANRKTEPRESRQPVDPKKSAVSNEIKGIIVIALGIFLLFAFVTNTAGAIGEFIKKLFYGLLGSTSAVSCIFIILTGINIFINKRRDIGKGRIFVLIGIMLFTSILTALYHNDTSFGTNSFTDQITLLYQSGIDGNGGGVLGGGLCRLLVGLFGITGTWVLSVAGELVLIILLTGVSLCAVFRHLSPASLDRKKQERNDPEDKSQGLESEPTVKNKPRKFFDEYFRGKEPIDDRHIPDNSKLNSTKQTEFGQNSEESKPERFELKEDDDVFKGIFPDKMNSSVNNDHLPFKIDNMKTGTISELPITQADGAVTEQKNPEDDDEFVPPSEAKQEDVFDPLTKAAVNAGVPLDRAVDAGRRMAVSSDDTQPVPSQQVENAVTEAAANMPRIIQYRMPTTDLLDKPKPNTKTRSELKHELEEKGNTLLDTLRSFKVDAKIVDITKGPSVTRFELQPGVGVKVSKITGLADDIALSLAAPGVRIEAPIPGKSAVGIEIPNNAQSPVPIRDVLESEKFISFPSKTAFALGKDIAGRCIVADIAKFPHVLIAGQTGSGKSVCINSLILSILYKAKPDEVKLIMVDPKMVELEIYNGIPHLLIPVVTDPKHAAGALNWAVTEMQNRYNLLKDNNVRNLKGYNSLMEERGEPESKLPEIVIIIDEFADLMIVAKSEVENAINRLAALARAAGMYLVIATQRPTVNVITGVIKANIPSRIAFNVTSQVDSRTILDTPGAEKLLGRGDMLYNPSGAMKPIRIQGNFVSDAEIERVIDFIKSQYEADYDSEIIENIQREQEKVSANLDNGSNSGTYGDSEPSRGGEVRDELFIQAVEMVLENGQASVAMFQRRFKIGYQRAARLIDQMEERHIIGPYEGTKPRQVLISRQEFLEMKMNDKGQ